MPMDKSSAIWCSFPAIKPLQFYELQQMELRYTGFKAPNSPIRLCLHTSLEADAANDYVLTYQAGTFWNGNLQQQLVIPAILRQLEMILYGDAFPEQMLNSLFFQGTTLDTRIPRLVGADATQNERLHSLPIAVLCFDSYHVCPNCEWYPVSLIPQ